MGFYFIWSVVQDYPPRPGLQPEGQTKLDKQTLLPSTYPGLHSSQIRFKQMVRVCDLGLNLWPAKNPAEGTIDSHVRDLIQCLQGIVQILREEHWKCLSYLDRPRTHVSQCQHFLLAPGILHRVLAYVPCLSFSPKGGGLSPFCLGIPFTPASISHQRVWLYEQRWQLQGTKSFPFYQIGSVYFATSSSQQLYLS